jgi:hypothetical protein
MNKDTTLRTENTKEIIMNKLILKHRILPIVPKIILPEISPIKPINLEFIRGEIDGDGSFNVSFRSSRRRIGVNFTVVHELSSISVLEELVEFFGCGSVYKLPSSAARYQVQTVKDMLTKIKPILNNIEFNTIKQTHFEITMKVCEIINETGYTKDEDLIKFVDLAWDMNKLGKTRRMSKIEYL